MNQKFESQHLVSIIVNCFNGENYLKEAIDSIIAQTYQNWEVIFWDNKSTDKSAEIFKSYNDKRLNYYLADKHSKILYEARNYALNKTKGEFIAFLDVDDWWLPNKLEQQIPLFEDKNTGVVYSNFYFFFEKKRKKKIFKKKALPTGMILKELLNDYVIGSPTYVIRKKSLQSLKYNFNNNFHIIGDFDLNVRLSADWKIDCVQTPLAYARRHTKNESLIHKDKEIEETKIWYNKMRTNSVFSSQNKLDKIPIKILYLETMNHILKGDFMKSFSMIYKYPFCFDKIKLLTALLLPKFILRKIKNY